MSFLDELETHVVRSRGREAMVKELAQANDRLEAEVRALARDLAQARGQLNRIEAAGGTVLSQVNLDWLHHQREAKLTFRCLERDGEAAYKLEVRSGPHLHANQRTAQKTYDGLLEAAVTHARTGVYGVIVNTPEPAAGLEVEAGEDDVGEECEGSGEAVEDAAEDEAEEELAEPPVVEGATFSSRARGATPLRP